ncbi:MAG TPA: EAL domain-containing protein, partial [Xanthobacteraceae bacterium]|nr:EAL domain-containing protein [Xanthobacteraceae bacterium]
MSSVSLSSPTARRPTALPPEIYIPLVDSLYKDGRTLLIGTIFVAGSILVIYWKTGQALLFGVAVAIVLVAGVRGLVMRAYARARPAIKDNEVARRWERRYVAGAATSVGLLGICCYVAFAATSDAFAQLVSFSMTIAYVVGIFGRNFGSARFVVVQILCAWVPMTAALLLHGTPYHWIFAALLIPFFLGVKFIAERLRHTLLDTVVASRDMSLLANRFDTALNNMPHGLCMFDAERRIVVANHKLSELLGLPADRELKGSSPRQLIASVVDAGLISRANAERAVGDLDARLAGGGKDDVIVELQNGRTLELTVQPMESGGMVLLVEDITERKAAEARINHLARFDALTGLPNRTILRNCMDEALAGCRPDRMCAIHFIDLDQFKQVNDTLGHSRGDLLLVAVAERLRTAVRDSDVIARFGGDEFVVLQSSVKSPEEASALATRILRALRGTYELDGHVVMVSASSGISIAPRNGTDADRLLRNADMALYRAKSERRGTWRWFEPEMEADAQARRNLELDLRSATESDAFDLYYQPLFDLRTRRIVACEALLRWPHRERGMVSPAEFIPVAEEMGLIVEIGNQVLRKACLECGRWPDDVRVAVNLSSIQFGRSNIPALVRETLAATNLPARRLEIEITETTLLQDTRRTRAELRQLEALGVSISLDDFGTGYSSLSYLHSFPLHKVKIDQSFLQDLGDNERRLTLLRGMARLSAELGLRVVIEGVETEEQLALVAAEDSVDEVQGYLLGRPLPAADVR